MKRIKLFALSFIYLAAMLFSIIIIFKPGAGIFYKKSSIQTQTIVQVGNAYEIQFKVDQYIYDPATVLVLEDETFLDKTKTKKVKSDISGCFSLSEVKNDHITILFNSSSSNPFIYEHSYSIYIRPYLISRTTGVIAFCVLLLGFLAITFFDPQNRQTVFKSPFGIVIIWANGSAGRSIENSLKSIDVNFLISNILVPIVLLAVYCIFFAFFSAQNEIEGVNYNFVSILWRYLLILVGIIYLVLFVVIKIKGVNELSFRSKQERIQINDLILLLFPLTPVVQYIISNQESLISINQPLYVLIFFILFSILLIFIIPELLGIMSSKRTTMMLGLSFAYTVINMASLTHQFKWYEIGDLWIQILVLVAVFLAFRFIDKKILYIFIVISFVANSVYQGIARKGSTEIISLPIEKNELFMSVDGRKPAITPNIYLMVYESYAQNETMLAYGIDNSTQENYLAEKGFKLYPHTYSIGSSTINSMSRVLNASTEFYGNKWRAVSGDGVIQNLLKDDGYKTLGIFVNSFMFRGVDSSYDYSIPERETGSFLTEGILLGEFRFDIGFYESQNGFSDNKQSILKEVFGNPIFAYAHSSEPGHSPTSGACLGEQVNLYKEKLKTANRQMSQDIETIIQNDPKSIIIVAGDHGPRLTKNCLYTSGVYDISEISRLDIQDRFGTFLAIRWPTEDFEEYDDITILQDIFPAVFAYIYGDEKILESKIEPVTVDDTISGAYVKDGIIFGGIDDGEPLFLSGN